MHNPIHNHEKLGPIATKMVFIKCSTHTKGYVMYEEHPNGGMLKINLCNVSSTRISEVKKDLELYELQQDFQPFLGEGDDLNSH